MALAVVSFVVARLGDLIIQEAKFLHGVSDQVEVARTELQLVQGFLKDADVRQRDDETVHILVTKIRNAAYDLEDIIETFVLEVASKREGGIKNVLKRFGRVLKEGVDLHKIRSEIEKITTQISNFRSSLQTHNIMEIRDFRGATSLYERQQQLRRSYSHIINRDVVGLVADVRELVMHLVKKEPRHQAVSIWGMGGLGKTTLAKQIYRHNEVRRHFGSFVWVCISQQSQVRDVWEELLIKLLSATTVQREEIAKMKDDEIAKRIYLLQQESRCLVVIDDIWSIETWESLKAAFPLNQRTESRILLTTRVKEVALHAADRNGILHQPRPLNEDESWELLEKIAIFGREEITSEVFGKMKEIGKKMLQHCAGLPLAVIVLAGLLARKDTIEEWDTVLNNVYAYIRRGKGHEQECMGTLWVLSLSYDNLPYHLKSCFLYLGIFPEDFEIPVKRLTQLWMAEGFISMPLQQTQGLVETMEEIAYNYLNELVDRCVVQIGERGSVRKIKSCRLHDLMRDLCLIKSEEEGFLQTFKSLHRSETVYSSPSLMIAKAIPTGKVRRLAICLDENVDKLVPSSYARDDRLRSLLYFCPLDWHPNNKKLVSSLFKDFKLLRVLKVEGMTALVDLPNEIGNMVHLRFLSLRYSHIKRLPSSLGNLILLQTLNLRFHHDSDMLPNVFWKMVQLRHLYLPLYYTARGNRLQLSTLHNLQTLNYVSSRCCELNDLAGLTSLRKLAIELASPLKNLEETLKGISSTLNGIRSLFVHNLLGTDSGTEVTQIVLSCRHVYKLELNGRTVELPGDLQHFPNLTKLSLCRCDLNHNQMAVLAKLPNLKILCLMEETFESSISDTLVFSNEGFRHLECLSLTCMHELKDLKVERGAMPSLRRLFIRACYRLTEVPNGLRYLTTLRELSFVAMSTTFRNRLQVGGEDFDKVQHVPSVVFANMMDSSEIAEILSLIGRLSDQHTRGISYIHKIEEWDTVLKNVYTYIRRGKGHEQECTGTMWVLSLSYDNLPYHLKSCFLYLGIFPEDFEIPVKRLTQLWMAEGFISMPLQQRQGLVETMEDIAYNYLNELVDRCVVQIGERGSVRKIKSCRLHDLMRDLCLIKSEEEGFLQNVKSLHRSETMYSSPPLTIAKAIPAGKVRRLAICLDENVDKLVPSSYERDDRLRSLLYFGRLHCHPENKKLVSSLFKDFKLLRVLKVEGMTALVDLPNEIGNMVHLRFLSLRDSHIKRLPSSLGNLILLQTLDLRFRYVLDMLPYVFWKMVQLRHLYLPVYYTARGNRLHLSTLHNLQTLNYVSSRCCELNDLAGLTGLRKLVIELASPLKNLEETLKGISSTLNGIRSLFVHNLLRTDSGTEVTQIVLSCRHVYKLELNGRTVELPGDLQHFPNLTKLSLCRCDLNHNQMAVLAKLPNLKILRLMEGTFESSISDTLVFSNEGFRHLECLSLICMYELKDLKVERGAMPSLRQLFIRACDRLTEVPNGLRYLTTLRELSFVAMSTTFRNRLQVGGEDFDKVQHVPSVVFADMMDSSRLAEIHLSRRLYISAQYSRGLI